MSTGCSSISHWLRNGFKAAGRMSSPGSPSLLPLSPRALRARELNASTHPFSLHLQEKVASQPNRAGPPPMDRPASVLAPFITAHSSGCHSGRSSLLLLYVVVLAVRVIPTLASLPPTSHLDLLGRWSLAWSLLLTWGISIGGRGGRGYPWFIPDEWVPVAT